MFVERQVSGVNLPFNLLQDPCVEGVGNGENRPVPVLPRAPGEVRVAKAVVRILRSEGHCARLAYLWMVTRIDNPALKY